MKRRDFLQYTGLGAVGAASAAVLPGCSKEENSYRFWQHGNYPPVGEEITETELKVEGAIPPELNGLYVRNGPNSASGPADHFFSGDGMLHGVRLENGEAKWYRNRFVDTPVYRKESGGFGPPKPEATTSAVSLIYHGDRLLSLGEYGYPYEINPEDLSTLGTFTYDGKLGRSMTAHPRIDPVTGELLFFGYNVMEPYVTYMRAAPTGEMVQMEPLDMAGPSMMHDFAATENYVIFMEMPVTFSWMLAVTGEALPFRWDDNAVCRFGVMPRTGTAADMRWFDVPSCFIFHVMNSFEQGDEVMVDAARYDKLWVKDSHDFNHPAYVNRFTLNMKTGQVSVQQAFERAMEFPQVNRNHWTLPYRYGYSLISDIDDKPFGEKDFEYARGFIKYDLQTGETVAHEVAAGNAPNEAVFVPASDSAGAGEDEGYLFSFVYDGNSKTSALWILDAGNLGGDPVAKVQLPVRVPQGFHGLWVPASATT